MGHEVVAAGEHETEEVFDLLTVGFAFEFETFGDIGKAAGVRLSVVDDDRGVQGLGLAGVDDFDVIGNDVLRKSELHAFSGSHGEFFDFS